jgi:hypothetical protein
MLVIVGTSLFGLGLFFLLVKLLMIVAWYAGGVVAIVGLILLLAGSLLRGG